jgi:signal transduction histidine kinase
MLMPASSEFVALCQAQVALITQTWGAAFSAVYLTENWAQDSPTDLIPVFIYPDNTNFRSEAAPPRLPTTEPQPSPTAPIPEIIHLSRGSDLPDVPNITQSSNKPERIVLPLIHDGIVLGLLVVGREDRQWHPREQEQLQQVARTLAIACVLDQRQQWLGQTNFQQRSLQAQQYDTLANLLHQFRNPLTTVRTVGKLLRKRLLPADNNRNLATNILNESDRLQQLLEQFDQVIDVGEAALEYPETPPVTPTIRGTALPGSAPLALAAAPTVGRPLQLQPCWLTEILEPVLMSAATIAQERNLELHLELPTDLPPVQADPQALREAITNLVDNALKYTPSGGQVQLQVQRHPARHQQTVTVSDTGTGIPATDLPRLFERHYRGVQARGEIPGTGLGLAIAQELIEQMQGQLQAISPATWQPAECSSTYPGSTFIITLSEIKNSTKVTEKQKQPG